MYAAGESDPDVLMSSEWRQRVAADIGIDAAGIGGISNLLAEDARRMRDSAPLGLRLVSPLILRHVSGRLFQEAHAVLESVQYGLFGGATAVTTPTYSPSGAYFTPVPIARLIAEWAIRQRSPLPDEVVISDYACGSGVFLTESLRALERVGFTGAVRVIGRDSSAQGITMANVAIRGVLRDIPDIRVSVDIAQADALQAEWPSADVVLMNPPFRSWERMSERQREWVHEVTGKIGRPDMSVGFIQRAMDVLRPSGVIATLLPAGVLASDTLARWRTRMLEHATPSLIAVLGEHGLFEHALVNVGILSMNRREPSDLRGSVHVGWSSAESGSASKLVRAIRRSVAVPDKAAVVRSTAEWTLANASFAAWSTRPSWLPGAGALGQLLDQIKVSVRRTPLEVAAGSGNSGGHEHFMEPAAGSILAGAHPQSRPQRAADQSLLPAV